MPSKHHPPAGPHPPIAVAQGDLSRRERWRSFPYRRAAGTAGRVGGCGLAQDAEGRWVVLFASEWSERYFADKNNGVPLTNILDKQSAAATPA